MSVDEKLQYICSANGIVEIHCKGQKAMEGIDIIPLCLLGSVTMHLGLPLGHVLINHGTDLPVDHLWVRKFRKLPQFSSDPKKN